MAVPPRRPDCQARRRAVCCVSPRPLVTAPCRVSCSLSAGRARPSRREPSRAVAGCAHRLDDQVTQGAVERPLGVPLPSHEGTSVRTIRAVRRCRRTRVLAGYRGEPEEILSFRTLLFPSSSVGAFPPTGTGHGGHAQRACNDARRVALSGEATLPRTARQRQIGRFERPLRTREALARHHLVRAGTQRPSKQPGKVIGAVADLLRQDRQGELLTQLRADERQHLLDLALTQPGWGWASRPGTRCTASSWAA